MSQVSPLPAAGADFSRLAIVNRGACALRALNATAEYNREHGTAISTVVLVTEADRRAWVVSEADDAVVLEPAAGPAAGDVDRQTLADALVASGADAAWAGWEPIVAHAELAELCEELGIAYVGPPAAVIRTLEDRIAAKRLAEEAGVPVLPWSGGPSRELFEARLHAETVGYPVMVKAARSHGTGGVHAAGGTEDLTDAYAAAQAEGRDRFGDETVFVEKQLAGARLIEVPVVADRHGTVWALGPRECTVQLARRKILHESAVTRLADPAPAARAGTGRSELGELAVRLCRAAAFESVGSVEFLWLPGDEPPRLLKVSTALSIQHPVTELTTGLDLVKLQLHLARGGRLDGDPPPVWGHAVQVRLSAEDPARGFAATPGRVLYARPPAGPGVRVESGIAGGDVITREFEPTVADIAAWGRDRPEALARLARALDQTAVVIEDGTTNRGFLTNVLADPQVRAGEVDTGWLDRLVAEGRHLSGAHAEVALVQAAIEAYDVEAAAERGHFYSTAARGRPEICAETGRRIDLRLRGRRYPLRVLQLDRRLYRVEHGPGHADVEVERTGPYERRLHCFGGHHRTVSVVQGPVHRVEVDGVPHRLVRDEGGVVHAPSSAVVVSVAVRPGDEVSSGDPLVVVESMKMETALTAPFSGRVRSVAVTANSHVDAGAPLVTIDVDGTDRAAEVEVEVDRRPGEVDPGEVLARGSDPAGWPAGSDRQARCAGVLAVWNAQILGFDVPPGELQRALVTHREACRALAPGDDEAVLAGEAQVLEIFADLCAVSRRIPDPDAGAPGEIRSGQNYLVALLRSPDRAHEDLPARFVERLRRALAHYGLDSLEPSPARDEVLLWMWRSQQRLQRSAPVAVAVLEHWLARVDELRSAERVEALRGLLERLIAAADARFPQVADLAREVEYRVVAQPVLDRARDVVYERVDERLDQLASHPGDEARDRWMREVVDCPQPLNARLTERFADRGPGERLLLLEVLIRRYYRIRAIESLDGRIDQDRPLVSVGYRRGEDRVRVLATFTRWADLDGTFSWLRDVLGAIPAGEGPVIELFVRRMTPPVPIDETAGEIARHLEALGRDRPPLRVTATVMAGADERAVQVLTFRRDGPVCAEDRPYRNMHPMLAERLELWRLGNFEIERLPSVEDVFLFRGRARENGQDVRLFAVAEVRDLTPVRDEQGRVVAVPVLERMYAECISALRNQLTRGSARDRPFWNRIILYVRPPWDIPRSEWSAIARRLMPATRGLGIQKTVVRADVLDPAAGQYRDTVMHHLVPADHGMVIRYDQAAAEATRPLSAYRQKVVKLQRRGLVYPYELLALLTPEPEEVSAFPPGEFIEHDLAETGELVPVARPPGQNTANLVAGVIVNVTDKHPEGMRRVALLGDPSKSLGSLAAPECRRIIAALDLAEREQLPVEWFAVSAGALISMTSGTENMDWISAVLRRLIEFTQAGGEVNVVVTGINVGAQPYWNAEATMLMHTRGILVMMPDSAMVLTGKSALEFSGSVSAEDNFGIGGFDRIMGPNGQAQYWAPDLPRACQVLFRHYDHTYRAPGERFPRRATTSDARTRDVREFPHAPIPESDFTRVGDVFSDRTNPERKKPFDIRSVLRAVTDLDHEPLERWEQMLNAETAVVWDAHIGGIPACLLGIESHAVARKGFIPADGPVSWTAGTLFPQSSKKIARAVNAASGNRPLVVLANLSGFDGSPESMRSLQLEFGAEIGRAVVNFDGPIVFCVVSRYHGGAFVVFSRKLNEDMVVAAVEGSRASVIGGAPAAAVVFAKEVDARTRRDAGLVELQERIGTATGEERSHLQRAYDERYLQVRSAKLGEVADEFDAVHNVQRAAEVGSVDEIIPASGVRPWVIGALEAGIERVTGVAGLAGTGGRSR